MTVVEEPRAGADRFRSDAAPTVILDPGDLSLVEGRMLLVANAGGHLSQLVRLYPRLPDLGPRPVWVTSENPQRAPCWPGRW